MIIDLEFDTRSEAEGLLAAMQVVWGRVQGTVIAGPQWRLSEVVETKNY